MQICLSRNCGEVAGCIKIYDMQKQQFNWLPPYSNSTLITFILTWQMEGHRPAWEICRQAHVVRAKQKKS